MSEKTIKEKKNNEKKFINNVSFRYYGVDDDGMEYGEYFEFPDLISLNLHLNKVLCRSQKTLTLRSVAFYINRRLA